MNKLIITNSGSANKGKSSSIKEVFKLLTSRYPEKVTVFHPEESGDVKAIIEIKGVLVGIESQGDPGSRLLQSLEDFKAANCQIIVSACRTFGETASATNDMHKFGYQVIWASNDKNWDDDSVADYLNKKYAERIIRLIEDRIDGVY